MTSPWLTQSRGGRVRAAKLSPERRSEIARKAALARWADPKPATKRRKKKSARRRVKKQGSIMAERLSKTHAQAIEAMKDQLLIVLIERLGGEATVSVGDIDGTGDRNLLMSLDQGWFHFSVRKKSAAAETVRQMIINKPDYDEH